MTTQPERMLLLRPGAPAQIQVALADPGPGVPAGSTLSAKLQVMNASGVVVAQSKVIPFTTPDGLVQTAKITDDAGEATAAAMALAGNDGRWELICDDPCDGTIVESGPAHSAVDTRRRTRIPSGCCGSSKQAPVRIVPVPSKDKGTGHDHKFDPKAFG